MNCTIEPSNIWQRLPAQAVRGNGG